MDSKHVITTRSGIFGGAPLLKGHRIDVLNAVESLVHRTPEEYIEAFHASDWLTVDDLKIALWYCRTRQCARDRHFCSNCTLNMDTMQTREEYVAELPAYIREEPELVETQWEAERNRDGWLMAAEVSRRLGYCEDPGPNGASAPQ